MQLVECVANIVLALCVCARKIEFLLCMYVLSEFFLLLIPRG